jgi:hypothetical protein
MPIDTHVDADPASCRNTARWLDGVSRAGEGAADEVVGARNASFDCWSGPAGDAFRDQAGRIGTAGDTTSAQARIGGQALDDFAVSAQGVLDAMTRARADAAAAGLPVTGELIGDPVAVVPPPLPTPPDGTLLPPEQVAAHQQATDAASAQRAAFEHARQVTEEARARYVEAQTELTDRIRAPTNEAVAVTKDVMLGVSSVTSTLGSLQGAAKVWAEAAERAAAQRAAMMGLMLAPGVPLEQAVRGALQARDDLAVAQRAGGANADALRRATLGASETSPGQRLLNGLIRYPGQFADSGLLASARPVLSRVPVVSLGFAGAGFVTDVAAGRSAGSAAAKQGATLAVGAGASWLTTAAVTAGATAIGVGAAAALPAVLVGVLVGGVAAYAVGADWDSIESTAEDLFS